MLKKAIDLLNKNFKPVSIFLYGSRARDDFNKRSDFEIGILIKKENYVRRGEIKKVLNEKSIGVFPFEYESFIKGKIDTPFQKKIYLRELILAGKTLSGEKVIEKMKAPEIKVMDLIQDLRFNLGYALASTISNRNGDKISSSLEFYKSCLFATRSLEILKLGVFPLTYNDIFRLSKKLELKEYSNLIKKAFNVRNGKEVYEEKDLFSNISYINEFIEELLLDFLNEKGNIILVK